MDRTKSQDLIAAFRETRHQVLQSSDSTGRIDKSKLNVHKQLNHPGVTSDKYSLFLRKYNNLQDTIESFTTLELVYFFREKAKESEVKYVIANMKRDMGIFKKLQSNYSKAEICLMIEFIFTSDQNYLTINRTQPTVLASAYCNKIYQDSLLWSEDKYVPEVKYEKKTKPVREWKSEDTSTTDKAEIGGWD